MLTILKTNWEFENWHEAVWTASDDVNDDDDVDNDDDNDDNDDNDDDDNDDNNDDRSRLRTTIKVIFCVL